LIHRNIFIYFLFWYKLNSSIYSFKFVSFQSFLNDLGLSFWLSDSLFLLRSLSSFFMLNFLALVLSRPLFSNYFNLFSIFCFISIPNLQFSSSIPSPSSALPKASTRTAKDALAARLLLTLPFTLLLAWPTRLAWNKMPYLGVSLCCFNAWNNAFSAPNIWRVLDGYFARLTSEPAAAISFAPTRSPTKTVRFGASIIILFCK